MTTYNPFDRGSRPVGTRSFNWTVPSRDYSTPVDIWYPATAAYQGQDLDPEHMDRYEMIPGTPEVTQMAVRDAEPVPGRYPLVVFSHGFGGERRQSTFFCTHLASHGYVVAAMDHVGNTTIDMMSGEGAAGDPGVIERFIESRPVDASFVIDCMLAGDSGLSIEPDQVGMSGHSFGGWTTLKTTGLDRRIKAALPLAPAGGIDPETENPLGDSLDFEWGRPVPTLYLVAELDSILPLAGMQDLHARNPEPRKTVVLENADHFHFNDNIEATHEAFKMMMTMLGENADEAEREALMASIAQMKPCS